MKRKRKEKKERKMRKEKSEKERKEKELKEKRRERKRRKGKEEEEQRKKRIEREKKNEQITDNTVSYTDASQNKRTPINLFVVLWFYVTLARVEGGEGEVSRNTESQSKSLGCVTTESDT